MIKNKLTLCFLFLLGVMISSYAQNDRIEIKTQLDFKIDSMRVALDFPAVAYGVLIKKDITLLSKFYKKNLVQFTKSAKIVIQTQVLLLQV